MPPSLTGGLAAPAGRSVCGSGGGRARAWYVGAQRPPGPSTQTPVRNPPKRSRGRAVGARVCERNRARPRAAARTVSYGAQRAIRMKRTQARASFRCGGSVAACSADDAASPALPLSLSLCLFAQGRISLLSCTPSLLSPFLSPSAFTVPSSFLSCARRAPAPACLVAQLSLPRLMFLSISRSPSRSSGFSSCLSPQRSLVHSSAQRSLTHTHTQLSAQHNALSFSQVNELSHTHTHSLALSTTLSPSHSSTLSHTHTAKRSA